MTDEHLDLVGLLGARICHDLISPLGAVANGLELMEITGQHQGEELELVKASSQAANSKLKFFRIAFGRGSPDQMLSPSHLPHGMLEDVLGAGRCDWSTNAPIPQSHAKLACLLVLCAHSALRQHGRIRVKHEGNEILIFAEGQILPDLAPLLSALGTDQAWPERLEPTHVQFPLARQSANNSQLTISYNRDVNGFTLKAEPAEISCEQRHPLPQDT